MKKWICLCLIMLLCAAACAMLAEGRADGRRGRRLAGIDLQLDKRSYFLCHWGILLYMYVVMRRTLRASHAETRPSERKISLPRE